MLTVRRPDFDFSDSVPHWGDNVEAVTIFNAGAIIPSPIERYLIRVMRLAKQELDPVADADLIEEIDLFNKQEGQHHKLHNGLMEMLTTRYPRLRDFESAFAADLEDFMANRSLAWNLAYCEGFESTGCALAEAFVDGGIAAICGDHGSTPMRLWTWHMAEEFEHRAVVHDVLRRLYGPEEAFRLRTEGATFNRRHNAEHVLAAAVHITEIDQAGMADDEREASDRRALEAAAAVAALSAEAASGCTSPTTTHPRWPRRGATSGSSTTIPEPRVGPVDRAVHHTRRPAGRFTRPDFSSALSIRGDVARHCGAGGRRRL